MVLNLTTYGVFQDQSGFERERKMQCSERAARQKGPVVLHHSSIQKTQEVFIEGIPLRKEMK